MAGDDLASGGHLAARRHGDDHLLVVAGAQRGDAGVGQEALDAVEVDPQAERLHEPAPSPDDLEQALRGAAGEVARAELLDLGAAAEVLGALRVAHHHVGAAVDELAHAVGVGLVDLERAPGDRHADRVGVGGGQRRRQVGHARRGLGLPVHHEQVEPAPPSELGQVADALGGHPAARLGEVAQRGERHVVEADAVEQVEGVGHARQARGAGAGEEVPEAPVDDRQLGEDQRRAGQEVAVHHRQAVAVLHRQGGDRPLAGADAQVLDDRRGVRREVLVRQPHELRRTRRPRGRHEERQVRVERVPGAVAARHGLPRRPGPGDHVGVVGVDDLVGRAAGRQQQHDVAATHRTEVGDERLDPVGGLDGDQAPVGAQGLGRPIDPRGELAVGERQVAADDGEVAAAPYLVVEEVAGAVGGKQRHPFMLGIPHPEWQGRWPILRRTPRRPTCRK